MKLPKFNISEAYDEVLSNFQFGGSATEKLASTAKLLGKSAANIGMIATEIGADIVKNLPESNGRNAQNLLDRNSGNLTEEQRERLQNAVALGKDAKMAREEGEKADKTP